MKKTVILSALFALLALPAQAAPETYEFDSSHTNIVWFASHFGFSKSSGQFVRHDGTVTVDEAAPENSNVDITIYTDSLVTGLDDFDAHLKNEDFFNVEEHPEARFVSKSVEMTGENTAKVTGDFTMLGVTKPLVLDVVMNKKGTNPFNKKEMIGFSAKGTIVRSEYGMTYGLPGVSDEVELIIEAEAVKETAATDSSS